MNDNDTDPAGRWAGPVGREMVTAEQWRHNHQGFDPGHDAGFWSDAKVEAYAAAQLAEKERESRNLKCAVKLLTDRAEAAEQRLQGAQSWKESQLKVTPDWQKIGELLNVGLGQSVTENIIPAITDLRERLRQREAELERRWIAVGERLPEPGECLTYAPLPHSGGQYYDWIQILKYFDGKFHFYHTEDCEWIAMKVTHWQPLPSPPKEAK